MRCAVRGRRGAQADRAVLRRRTEPGTPEADRFDLLALIIEDYERKRWPIEPPDTIDAIRCRMELAAIPKPILAVCSAHASAHPTS
jgi:antitoxin component HigA of HigAB toxin-antitoxin module